MYDFPAGMFPWGPPMTIGHENTGTIHSVGAGVSGWQVGDRVAVRRLGLRPLRGEGADNYCANRSRHPSSSAMVAASGSTAAWPRYMLVPRRPLPREGARRARPRRRRAPRPGLTPYHAVEHAQCPGHQRRHEQAWAAWATWASSPRRSQRHHRARHPPRGPGPHRWMMPTTRCCRPATTSPPRSRTSSAAPQIVIDFVGVDATIALGTPGARPPDHRPHQRLPRRPSTPPRTSSTSVWGTRSELAEVGPSRRWARSRPSTSASRSTTRSRQAALEQRAHAVGGAGRTQYPRAGTSCVARRPLRSRPSPRSRKVVMRFTDKVLLRHRSAVSHRPRGSRSVHRRGGRVSRPSSTSTSNGPSQPPPGCRCHRTVSRRVERGGGPGRGRGDGRAARRHRLRSTPVGAPTSASSQTTSSDGTG